jgi:hypothetical protein
VFLLPFTVGHAVDSLPRLLSAYLYPQILSSLSIPFAQAVAAKVGEYHQVDILHLFVFIKMLEKPPKCCGFELSALMGLRHNMEHLPVLGGAQLQKPTIMALFSVVEDSGGESDHKYQYKVGRNANAHIDNASQVGAKYHRPHPGKHSHYPHA